MKQQILAAIIILAFVSNLFSQKKKKEIGNTEFGLWLIFWIFAAVAVAFIKQIDNLIGWLGFSGNGIDFLIYLAVLSLFYFVISLRLKLAKTDRQLTEITRKIALKKDE
jgi:hypothetical protein